MHDLSIAFPGVHPDVNREHRSKSHNLLVNLLLDFLELTLCESRRFLISRSR
jgi:hypothetical protein